MATKDSNIKGDIRFLNFLWPYTKWSKENKIKKIDTAPSYDVSEKIIGYFSKNKFQIISSNS